MLLQKQLNKHDPKNGIYGDCYRTCIAVLLDMNVEDVPHFADHSIDGDEMLVKINTFLAQHGVTLIVLAFGPSLDGMHGFMRKNNPGVPYLVGGKVNNGDNHVVICMNGHIIWDPSTLNRGLTGPCEDGYYWIEFLGKRLNTEVKVR